MLVMVTSLGVTFNATATPSMKAVWNAGLWASERLKLAIDWSASTTWGAFGEGGTGEMER